MLSASPGSIEWRCDLMLPLYSPGDILYRQHEKREMSRDASGDRRRSVFAGHADFNEISLKVTTSTYIHHTYTSFKMAKIKRRGESGA